MEKIETLKKARNLLLKLHKSMIDLERGFYEGIHGKLSPAEFVNLLMNDEDFEWLRKFSTLIVEIDELFARKETIDAGLVEACLTKVRDLVNISEPDEYFKAKYQFALQHDVNAASYQAELHSLFSE